MALIGTDFVAHIGKEGALRNAAGLCGIPCANQILIRRQ